MFSENRNPRGSVSGERGIALILVLWVMVLIAVLAIGFANTTRTDLQIVRNEYETARARTAADAAVSFGILALLDKSPSTEWVADGRPHPFMFDGTTVRVMVQDEGGKVDLNAAAPELLTGLFETLGIDTGQSLAFTQAILQRRQQRAEPLADVSGAEARSANRQPAGFVDISELRLLPGITRQLYQLVSPFVTVYSRGARIDPLTAPPDVLYAVPDLSRQDVDNFLAARAEPGAVPADVMAMLRTGFRFVGHRPLQTVTFRSDAITASKVRFLRTATVSLTPAASGQPYRVLAWAEGRVGDADQLRSLGDAARGPHRSP